MCWILLAVIPGEWKEVGKLADENHTLLQKLTVTCLCSISKHSIQGPRGELQGTRSSCGRRQEGPNVASYYVMSDNIMPQTNYLYTARKACLPTPIVLSTSFLLRLSCYRPHFSYD
eukprot:969420-Amorphochlora_amoeboformis.AAC.1